MAYRTICVAVTLSFIALFPPHLVSQDTSNSNRTRETVVRKVKAPFQKVPGRAAKRSPHAPVERLRASSINETEPRVSEAEAAEGFMHLKAQVNADISRLEDMRNAEPVANSVRASKSDFHIERDLTVNGGNPMQSRAQIMKEDSSKSSTGSNNK